MRLVSAGDRAIRRDEQRLGTRKISFFSFGAAVGATAALLDSIQPGWPQRASTSSLPNGAADISARPGAVPVYRASVRRPPDRLRSLGGDRAGPLARHASLQSLPAGARSGGRRRTISVPRSHKPEQSL